MERSLADARAGKGGNIAELERDLVAARIVADVIAAPSTGKLPDKIAKSDSQEEVSSAEAVNEVWQHAKRNPELMIYKLQSSAYKYAWLMIPFSVPFMWLLFPFSRRFHLYDHMVFVTYSVSFMLLLGIAASLLMQSGAPWAGGLLLLYSPYHMYRQARGTYGLSRFGAWWRTWFLALFALIVLILFATALALLVAAG